MLFIISNLIVLPKLKRVKKFLRLVVKIFESLLELEFIPAFATNCCDLRFTGGSRAIWNEEILINEVSEYLYNPEVVIIFEILDFHPMYL